MTYENWIIFIIKGGVCIFQKCFRKLSRAQYQNKLLANHIYIYV